MKACPSASERTLVEAPATIRTATVADASGIARVHVATSRAAYRTLVPPAAMERLSFPERAHCWESILGARPHGTQAWVAMPTSGGAVGFAAAGHARDHDLGCDSELYTIYVLPEHQRRGIGKRLFQAVVSAARAQRSRSMMAWVLAGNPSRAFFETLGGRQVALAHLRIEGARLTKVAYSWELELPPGGRRP